MAFWLTRGNERKKLSGNPRREQGLLDLSTVVQNCKNQDVSTGPLPHPFALLSHLLAPHCFAALILSLTQSLRTKLVGKWIIRCIQTTWFCPTVPSSCSESEDCAEDELCIYSLFFLEQEGKKRRRTRRARMHREYGKITTMEEEPSHFPCFLSRREEIR